MTRVIRPAARAEKMRKAGFTWVAMGIESFVDHVREGVDKITAQQKLLETINSY